MLNIKNTLDGFLKGVEIKGNTIQDAENLADIRSVGDKVEGQELYKIDVVSCGKNLFDKDNITLNMTISSSNNGLEYASTEYHISNFIPIKPDTRYLRSTGSAIFYYDKDYKFISMLSQNQNSPSNARYCKLQLLNTWDLNVFQFEEGTVATPYEPYQEDKLTILSPVQLEKVGDVADRIICKDGVWGVEKNIETKIFNNADGMAKVELTNVYRYNMTLDNAKIGKIAISNKYAYIYNYSLDEEHFYIGSANKLYIFVNKTNTNAFPFEIKYITTQPTFISLPHDQQVKLRTFAGQTNIHFETEIEGVIKAQVPKSLGATVNTHTEQIDILNKKVFKIEEIDQVQQDMMILESDMRILDIELALMEHMPITLNLSENTMLRSATYFNFIKNHIVNETYSKDYLENVMNKYLATNRLTQEEYNELYKLLYPQNYDIELPIEE